MGRCQDAEILQRCEPDGHRIKPFWIDFLTTFQSLNNISETDNLKYTTETNSLVYRCTWEGPAEEVLRLFVSPRASLALLSQFSVPALQRERLNESSVHQRDCILVRIPELSLYSFVYVESKVVPTVFQPNTHPRACLFLFVYCTMVSSAETVAFFLVSAVPQFLRYRSV